MTCDLRPDDSHPIGCACEDCAYWCDGNQLEDTP